MGRTFGDGSTDYEKYVRAQDLYRLVKDSADWANEEEALFQVTHMSMELWLAVVIQHLDQITVWLEKNEEMQATRFLNRTADILGMLTASLAHLEKMPPWKYHAIRVTLGVGSGQQSPTYNHVPVAAARVLAAYEGLLGRKKLGLAQIQQDPERHASMHGLTNAMLNVDEQFLRWRFAHYQLVQRIIGNQVLSLKGVPASALAQTVFEHLFPALWAEINATTTAFNKQHGAPGLSGGYGA